MATNQKVGSSNLSGGSIKPGLTRPARVSTGTLTGLVPGPLEVREIRYGDIPKAGIPASPGASICLRAGEGRSSKLTGPPKGGESPTKWEAQIGTRAAWERTWVQPPAFGQGTDAQEQETGGAVRPCTTSSPPVAGKGSARSPSLASEGGAQIQWDAGTLCKGCVRGSRKSAE